MSRPDQSITFLRDFGYSVIRFPKPGRHPLEVLERKGKDLDTLGDLRNLIAPGSVASPQVASETAPGVSIEGKESSKVNVSIGITILGSIIKALGGSNLGLTAAYNKAKTVTFEYRDVVEDSVNRLELEQFVKQGSIRPENAPGTIDKLIDDEIYVITSILKSKKFVISAQAENGGSLAVEVPVIQGAVGGTVKVTAEGGIQSKVSYEGLVALAFAAQAVQLVFDDSQRFLTTEPLPPGAAALRALAPGAAPQGSPVFLSAPGAFVRFSD